VNEGRNFLDGVDDPLDTLQGSGLIRTPGHGTRTLSALCGLPTPTGFTGCAPGLFVVPYRVVDDVVLEPGWFGTGVWRTLATALRHAVHVAGCDVVSMSLGGFGPDSEFGAALDDAYQNGVIVVAACGQKSDRVTYPGKYSRVTGVGGISRLSDGSFGTYEDYGEAPDRIDVWAPADPIRRADVNSPADPPPGDVGDGTSYATVHVAASAAIWLRYHEQKLAAYDGWRKCEAFWHALSRSQQALPPTTRRYLTGVLDADALLDIDVPAPDVLEPNWQRAEAEHF
jgi:hypothetical protein